MTQIVEHGPHYVELDHCHCRPDGTCCLCDRWNAIRAYAWFPGDPVEAERGTYRVDPSSPLGQAMAKAREHRAEHGVPNPDDITVTPIAVGPFRPTWAVHPGEILQEEIAERGWSHEHTADELGWHRLTLAQVLEGTEGVNHVLAADLSRVLGTSPQFWLNLQAQYDAHRQKGARQ